MESKSRVIGYWVTTGLVSAAMLAGGVSALTGAPAMVQELHALGYPLYFVTLLGFWKVAAAPALLVPGLPRLKEWAYAGIFFDLTGAAVSHASSGDPASKIVTPLVILLIAAASWALRPASRAWKRDETGSTPNETARGIGDVPARA